ncbi:CheR family methyltransferase [Caulobacter sp. NIBR2454]|uniref:CheR family methyltransferase n=1 Tax=Caulobacter sp. NIBR2454 TaxID=3015996 RepID=UPI0022B75318|nr:protein-glutamate O-methyltransferase CheR [Caulobacter sp. NIBR2454]
MKPSDLEFLAALCRSRAGLKVALEKTYLINSRLSPVARREGFASIDDMIAMVRSKREERLIWAVVEAMTGAETAFFFPRDAFNQFEKELLPAMAHRRPGGSVRIWSAACATGQEAYSLAMMAEEARGVLPGLKPELFGSDISERCLEKAQSGLYTQFEVQRGLPVRRLVAHFEKVDEMWSLDARVRQMVRWRRINLISDLSALGRFDIIFLRGVLATMDEAVRGRVLENVAVTLADDGFLVLSPGDEPAGLTSALTPVDGHPEVFGRDPDFRKAA